MKNALLISLLLATATGCGGGSPVKATTTPIPPPAPPPVTSPPPAPLPVVPMKGFISGNFGSRAFHGAVFPDGTLYGIYPSSSNASAVGGAVQGSGSSSTSNTYTASNLRDYNGEGLGVRDATYSATFEDQHSISGTVSYVVSTNPSAPLGGSVSYTAVTSSLATVAGNYSGSLALLPNAALNASLTIDSTGHVTGFTSSGCRFSGSLSPVSLDAVYGLSLSLGAAPCVPTNTNVNGGAFFTVGILYGVAQPSDRSSAVAFSLTKQ